MILHATSLQRNLSARKKQLRRIPLVQQPAGGSDSLPVIIAQGQRDGPTFWLTTGIHGIEHAGIQVIHRLITPELLSDLCGTLVAIPALNPAWLRTHQRKAYYHAGDPNRLFPDVKPPKSDPDKAPPRRWNKHTGGFSKK